ARSGVGSGENLGGTKSRRSLSGTAENVATISGTRRTRRRLVANRKQVAFHVVGSSTEIVKLGILLHHTLPRAVAALPHGAIYRGRSSHDFERQFVTWRIEPKYDVASSRKCKRRGCGSRIVPDNRDIVDAICTARND